MARRLSAAIKLKHALGVAVQKFARTSAGSSSPVDLLDAAGKRSCGKLVPNSTLSCRRFS